MFQGVSVTMVTVSEGCEQTVLNALETAERENSWLVIDQLHLATDSLLNDLRFQLQRLHRYTGQSVL